MKFLFLKEQTRKIQGSISPKKKSTWEKEINKAAKKEWVYTSNNNSNNNNNNKCFKKRKKKTCENPLILSKENKQKF